MTVRQVRIGAVPDAVQYDDVDFPDSAIETDQPIKAGVPVDPNDVVRLDDLDAYVFGPVAAVDSNLAEFDGITGKKIKDGGLSHASVAEAVANYAAKGANTDITSLSGLTTAMFSASISANQVDVTGDGTAYNITGAIWTELVDRGDCFSNGTFTAKATKQHLFTGIVVLDNAIGSAHTYGLLYLMTSNRNYPVFNGAVYNLSWSGSLSINFAIMADMDVNDTAYLRLVVYNGTKVIDVTTNTIFAAYELQ